MEVPPSRIPHTWFLAVLFIFWRLWNMLFNIFSSNRWLSEKILRLFFLKSRFMFYFSFDSLNYLEKFFFKNFYLSHTFSYSSFFFIDWNNFFLKRLYFYPMNYLYITQYTLDNKTIRQKSLMSFSLDYHFYKNATKVKTHYDLFFKSLHIYINYFYSFYIYYAVYYNYLNTDYSYLESNIPFFFLVRSNSLNKNKDRLYYYTYNQFDDFYHLVALLKKKRRTLTTFKRFNINKIKTLYFKKLLFMRIAYNSLYKNQFKLGFTLLSKEIRELSSYKLSIAVLIKILPVKQETTQSFVINHKTSNATKNLNSDLDRYSVISYLRRTKIFNKSRYSRNRQLYRTGVYWCLWVNIIVVYGLYFLFYRFTFNFGYLWIGLFAYFSTFIFSRVYQSKFYSLSNLSVEFNFLVSWFKLVIYNLTSFLNSLYSFVYCVITPALINYSSDIMPEELFKITHLTNWYLYPENSLELSYHLAYLWEYLKEEDVSIFRIKSIVHWLKQVNKLLDV